MQTTRLKDKLWISTATAMYLLERPPGYKFVPGQYFAVRLPGAKPAGGGPQDVTHTFSIASPPEQQELAFATRMRRSAYKDRLDALDEGAELEISDPAGDLQLQSNSRRQRVLIAGGIGITPFRSMLLSLRGDQSSPGIVLLYSNRRPQDAAFFQELQQLEEEIEGLRLQPTITQPEFAELSWSGATGRIDGKFIQQAVPRVPDAEFYVAGPPGMVKAMETLLHDMGVPGNQVYAEQFAGYEKSPAGAMK